MAELFPHTVGRQSEYTASITRRRAELVKWLGDLSKTPLFGRLSQPLNLPAGPFTHYAVEMVRVGLRYGLSGGYLLAVAAGAAD
jgi:hypothetical protein